jgi:hypothetical protein
MTQSEHPSFLELDRLALGAAAGPSTRSHVTECAACREHIARVQSSAEVPAWAARLARKESASAPVSRWRWIGGGGLALAAATAILLFIARAQDADPEFTSVKGTPSVAVHVKRGDRVFLWDGQSPVWPDDRLRLQVSPDGFRYISVFSASASGDPAEAELLYEAMLPPSSASVLLPKAWQVDAAAGPETLVVVLSDRRVPISALRSDPGAMARQGAWMTTLTLQKHAREDLDQ